LDASAEDTKPFKMVRYPEGGAEKMERTQIINDRCDGMVIRNLRGAFMSVPVKPNTGTAYKSVHCNSSPAESKP
jgi:hypothetical protein